ncbi:F0F1 ATP synthase subunit gamma [Vibrio metschnikovii]|uniref:ATP synthase gamma chain n=7 Tax=Bacteria TaxID=2 RepID=A0A9X0UP09_VIBME|nr:MULTISPECIES: F0F1 ATP synthase subunit gamma [Vibrio]EKO3558622.1 F0F1 ATP synthase subunit gamma [Vibrio metschnikovii]EKO3566466.1 F0F1 ATP synthase subunit gamma [Vibrio metschnikovii]EKO3569770.1 F0F1 ATP synthase subunit gamma [Vibrio metschnikovii]EKO3576837.1 F0F1 ATP synthase subunit gamma [Vibrio metschnikovii]EKO3586843.1 F0F1 ATP synthase subunit gamma [Vibrio metschnikovii]
MANTKEIRSKIGSVKSTQKITKAMEMVAASKMRRTQDAMEGPRPYSKTIRKVIGHLANGTLEFTHPYLEEREAKRVGYIVVSTDRGLCGGLNINMFKKAVAHMNEYSSRGTAIEIAMIGSKGSSYFRGIGAKIVAQKTGIGDEPQLDDLIGSISVMLTKYKEGEIDRLFLVYNEFVNSMTQQPKMEQLLPLPKAQEDDSGRKHAWSYMFESDQNKLLNTLMTRYIEAQVYQSVVENLACEMSARMVAMRAASDNAGNLIDDLQLVYNKARQAAITQELSEIVSGAAAV